MKLSLVLSTVLACLSWGVLGATVTPIVITSPHGGEYFVEGQKQTVTLAATTTYKSVSIELSRDGGTTWTTLGTINNMLKTNKNMLPFTVAAPDSTNCVIRATGVGAATSAGLSNSFSINASSGGTIPPVGAAGGDLTGTYPNPTVAPNAVTAAKVGSASASSHFVLAADGSGGTDWEAQQGGPISGTAGGDLSGTYPNPTIAAGAVTPGKLNSTGATSGQVLAYNGSNVAWVAPFSGPPVGAAGGDLNGTYPNPTIAAGAVTPSKLSSTGASSGQILTCSGSNVVWGVTPSGSPIGSAGGDLTGTYPNPTLKSAAVIAATVDPTQVQLRVFGAAPGGQFLTGVNQNGTTTSAAPSGFSMAANHLSDMASPSIARTALGAAASGTNSDLTSLSGLTTPLSSTQGGAGLAMVGSAGAFLHSNGSTWTSARIQKSDLPVSATAAQIALLQWFPATQAAPTFSAGTSPSALCFDGANVWVVNNGSSNVSELLASSGTTVATYPTGSNVYGACFDGANIWMANYPSANVTKMRASDGTTVGTYSAGSSPAALCFDGTNIWVANSGSNNVTKLLASDGSTVGTYPVVSAPYGICFDGVNIWVPNYSDGNVTKLLASTGASVGNYSAGTNPVAVCFDGANIWVANHNSNNVTKILASNGTTVGTYTVGSSPSGICFDGTNIWVTNGGDNTVTQLRASTGATVTTYAVGASPLGICFDGAHIWIANSGDNTVSKL